MVSSIRQTEIDELKAQKKIDRAKEVAKKKVTKKKAAKKK